MPEPIPQGSKVKIKLPDGSTIEADIGENGVIDLSGLDLGDGVFDQSDIGLLRQSLAGWKVDLGPKA